MEIEDKDLYWLAGILEGEGSFMKPSPSSPNRPIISLQMTDEDIIARVANLFKIKYQKSLRDHERRGYKPVYAAVLRGKRAVEWMNILKPLMGERRQGQIEKAVSEYKVLRKILTPTERNAIVLDFRSGMKAIDVAKKHSIRREYVYRLDKALTDTLSMI